MKTLELTIPGKPVPWARPGKAGKRHYTPKKQDDHRAAVAWQLKMEAKAAEVGKFIGPVYLQVVFVHGKEPGTWLRLTDIDTMGNLESVMPFELGDEFHTGRPDIDNLVKQLMEAIGDSGVLSGEDGQISMVNAAKLKR